MTKAIVMPASSPESHSSAHALMANAIRFLAMDAVEKAASGHPGMPMGMADIATVLFRQFLKFDPQHPEWPDRDRFVVSNGHGSMLLYALLYLTGYEDITLEEIQNFRQLGAKTAGHPEYGVARGIETTTGPLGQGLANAVGFAIAEQVLATRFGENAVNHHTYVLVGDGCLMEGISHEAMSLAGHLQLGKLIVLFDDNHISIDGSTALSVSDNACVRLGALGWHTQAIDGHDAEAIEKAITLAQADPRPSFVACRTTIAYGAPKKAGTAASHGSPLGKEEIDATRKVLGWEYPPFTVPEAVLQDWRAVGAKGKGAYEAWAARIGALPVEKKKEFLRTQDGVLPAALDSAVLSLKRQWVGQKPSWATRKASGEVLEMLGEVVPELLGGSADLTGSNLTQPKALKKGLAKEDFSGRYIYYGVREHAMAAIMNGLALHKGIIPYGGTFLVFTDYCRPSIRLSALMKQRVIYVMTHDSIGLGEDGPTHQPVEHLASLRAIPSLYVFRPADAVETLECWHLALARKDGPSLLALTRQAVPPLRTVYDEENRVARGAYVLYGTVADKPDVTLFATGSEVAIALQAAHALEEGHTKVRVVSVPCWELFMQQEVAYQDTLLKGGGLRVAVEAASSFGWGRFIGEDGIFIGMPGFGESAPAEALYEHFGITSQRIVKEVSARIGIKNSGQEQV